MQSPPRGEGRELSKEMGGSRGHKEKVGDEGRELHGSLEGLPWLRGSQQKQGGEPT